MQNIGPVDIPPLVPLFRLEDRAVPGLFWSITHDTASDRIAIRDDVPDFYEFGYVHVFPAFDGPRIGTAPTARLLIRNGHLGFEIVPPQQGVRDQDQSRILTRRSKERKLEIKSVSLPHPPWKALPEFNPWMPGFATVTVQPGVYDD